MKRDIQRYFNSRLKGRFCENCEKGFAEGDPIFLPNDKQDSEVIRGKIFCDIHCAEAYFDRNKPIN